VFQKELADSFADADEVVVAQVARLELLAPDQRLDPQQLMQDLKKSGKAAAYLPDVGTIVNHVLARVEGGEVIVVFSNGGFGGIHDRLLSGLAHK
jgi:UDP-N-acetylmuramate: L-alanyl-gamma-D-glutamyl-meso-diaminopimelate ligase